MCVDYYYYYDSNWTKVDMTRSRLIHGSVCGYVCGGRRFRGRKLFLLQLGGWWLWLFIGSICGQKQSINHEYLMIFVEIGPCIDVIKIVCYMSVYVG